MKKFAVLAVGVAVGYGLYMRAQKRHAATQALWREATDPVATAPGA